MFKSKVGFILDDNNISEHAYGFCMYAQEDCKFLYLLHLAICRCQNEFDGKFSSSIVCLFSFFFFPFSKGLF